MPPSRSMLDLYQAGDNRTVHRTRRCTSVQGPERRDARGDLPSFEQKYQMHTGVLDTLRR